VSPPPSKLILGRSKGCEPPSVWNLDTTTATTTMLLLPSAPFKILVVPSRASVVNNLDDLNIEAIRDNVFGEISQLISQDPSLNDLIRSAIDTYITPEVVTTSSVVFVEDENAIFIPRAFAIPESFLKIFSGGGGHHDHHHGHHQPTLSTAAFIAAAAYSTSFVDALCFDNGTMFQTFRRLINLNVDTTTTTKGEAGSASTTATTVGVIAVNSILAICLLTVVIKGWLRRHPKIKY
jgi:hypothetical protein